MICRRGSDDDALSHRGNRICGLTTGARALAGDKTTINNGKAAPAADVAADVRAVCTGRAVLFSEIPSSSRAWALNASFAISA